MVLHSLYFWQPAHSLSNPGFLLQFVRKMTLQSLSFKNRLILRVLSKALAETKAREKHRSCLFLMVITDFFLSNCSKDLLPGLFFAGLPPRC